ncbi:hypothetical protein [Nocardia sp. 348MFTsu5.1]|uniref:hypothetical protein n=1 Tax=Nocardia sp. 348MFTsu5.1 TaxID=1172185 RepID=UPI000366043E|nr:hypothetical protein [Nocardia sp. 348MFTsu5.1]
MSSKPVEPAARPALVTRAYWLWTISGALIAVYGVAFVIVSLIEGVGGTVALGVFYVAIGGALIAAARRVVSGDSRWRSALAVFTLMLVFLGILGSFLTKGAALPLLFSLIALIGSMMAYRPSSDPWFEDK